MSSGMRRTRRLLPLLLVMLLGGLSGCFSARNARPLTPGEQTASPVPILPVLASQVRITVTHAKEHADDEFALADTPRESYEHVADLVNEILDNLTREHSSLTGPSRVRRSLPESTLERLNVYLDDPGPIDEAWKVRGLEGIGLDLDSDKIVRVRVQLLLEEEALSDLADAQAHWKGQAKVSAELLGLSPAASLALGEGEDRLWGKAGVFAAGGYGGAVVVPYAYGRGLGKSLDNAARQALSGLLATMGEVP